MSDRDGVVSGSGLTEMIWFRSRIESGTCAKNLLHDARLGKVIKKPIVLTSDFFRPGDLIGATIEEEDSHCEIPNEPVVKTLEADIVAGQQTDRFDDQNHSVT